MPRPFKELTLEEFLDVLELFPFRPRNGSGPAVIISNRKLEPVYNLEQLIRAAPGILRRHPQARFAIFGDGYLKPELEALAAGEGVSGSVRFAGGIDHDDVPRTLADGDLYVSCSRSDGTSACLLEAMATGLYPVVSDIEANREWIRNNETGALVPLDDPEALAAAVNLALESAEARRQAVVRNRQLIEQKASWAVNMGRIEAAYFRLAGRV